LAGLRPLKAGEQQVVSLSSGLAIKKFSLQQVYYCAGFALAVLDYAFKL